MKILENKDYKFVSKEDLFTDKKLGRIAHVINGKTFYRYEDCILSGNALKDKNGIFLAQAIATRPDYTIFDEVRRREDFTTFADLRLTGVGMVGVVHANSPLDAIQRFIGKIELGIIPNILDTVVFVKD